MSIKSKVLAAAAVLSLAGGLTRRGRGGERRHPACANNCLTPKSAAYPRFVESALFGIPLRGVPTIVSPAAGWNPGEDFTLPTGTPVNAAWLRTRHGVRRARPASTGAPALPHFSGSGPRPTASPPACSRVCPPPPTRRGPEPATMQRPGRPRMLILDFNDSQVRGKYSIINASTTIFTHPFVMTILGNPAGQLVTPIILQHLLGNPGNVPANELWSTASGTL